MKYFKEQEERKVLLSDYKLEVEEKLKLPKYYKYEEVDLLRLDKLIDIFGDISLEESTIDTFLGLFRLYGGRYSVLTDDDTLLGLLSLKARYPFLSAKGIEEIGIHYIKDLFDKYSLDTVLQDFIDEKGLSDETIESYIEFVDSLGRLEQKKYIEFSKELDSLSTEYSSKYVDYLKSLVVRKHISVNSIKRSIPSPDLIKKDEEQVLDFSKKTRIYFGICYPMSYELTYKLSKDGDLDDCDERFIYTSSTGMSEHAKFTKSDFLESIRKRKIKSL